MLPVDISQMRTQLFQQSNSRRPVIHEHPAFSV